ncbi:MAG TPA: histidine kinase [Actinomycetota bacterium]|nr:histidine kinase [Actinomycetota bacterium]
MTLSIRWTNRKRLAVGAIGLAYALAALAVARVPGATSYAGRSGATAALVVVAGLSLFVGGLVVTSVEPIRKLGELAVIAGFTWFAPIWEGWYFGPPVVRSLGMLMSGFTFALLAHIILAYPTGGVRSRNDRWLVRAVYLEAVLVGIGLALFRDPFFDLDCWINCTDNVFLVRSVPGFARAIVLADRWFTVAAATALIASVAWRLATGSASARRAAIPIVAPTVMLTGAIWGRVVALLGTPIENPADPVFFMSFVVGALSVVLLALAVVWAAVRSRLQHRAVTQIVTNLREVPAPGSVETALGLALGDPELRIAYWLPASARFVDATGARVPEPTGEPGRSVTTLLHEDRRVAVVSHLATLPDLQRELGTAVRLGLENERLQAEVLAQLHELRASRARIVETGDAARRRLERDLHDGAQQRLLALSYDIRLALTAAQADGDATTATLLQDALDRSQPALDELRELAHGIYPAILAEAGLGPALESLADAAPIPVEIRDAVTDGCAAAADAAAYLVAEEGISDAAGRGATHAMISATRAEGRLVITVEDDGAGRTSRLVGLQDRLGAAGGELVLEPRRIRGEVPCG